jgi:hypothetical protein
MDQRLTSLIDNGLRTIDSLTKSDIIGPNEWFDAKDIAPRWPQNRLDDLGSLRTAFAEDLRAEQSIERGKIARIKNPYPWEALPLTVGTA